MENNKKFKKLDYEGFLFWNGNKQKNKPIAEEIKKGLCDYYILEDEHEICVDLYVFNNEKNTVNCHICNALSLRYDLTMEFLKETYGKVTFVQDCNAYGTKLFDKIRKSYKVIKESVDDSMPKFPLTKLYVDLNKSI